MITVKWIQLFDLFHPKSKLKDAGTEVQGCDRGNGECERALKYNQVKFCFVKLAALS